MVRLAQRLTDQPDPDPAAIARIAGELSAIAVSIWMREFDTGPRGRITASGRDYAVRIRRYLAARAARAKVLDGDWFADPAWDLLLDLLASEYEGRAISISSGCIAAAVPPTTALRYIERLVQSGAIKRHGDPRDRRRSYLTLSPTVAERLERWVGRYLPAPSLLSIDEDDQSRTLSSQA